MNDAMLVIAPHPDDEVLGAGAIMARAAAAGVQVGVVIATDGSRSDPAIDPRSLATQRQAEARKGLATLLGYEPPILFLDQPDGALHVSAGSIAGDGALAAFVRELAPKSIIVTDPADAHTDHKAAFGLATRLISAGFGQILQVMPVSQRVDGTFSPIGYNAVAVGDFTRAKCAALECHASQFGSSGGFALLPQVCEDFQAVEYLKTAFDRNDCGSDAIHADHFDAMFAGSTDPWGYDDSPYERDRFRRTILALGGRRYRSALELGCANGALTEQLVPLCDRLVATDASSAALEAARRRLGHVPSVTLEKRALPHDLPTGHFDLIVASDMLYYLGLEGVVTLMSRLDAVAAKDCRMLIASYLGETDTRLTGEMASEAALAHLPDWVRVHTERTDQLRIDVLDRS